MKAFKVVGKYMYHDFLFASDNVFVIVASVLMATIASFLHIDSPALSLYMPFLALSITRAVLIGFFLTVDFDCMQQCVSVLEDAKNKPYRLIVQGIATRSESFGRAHIALGWLMIVATTCSNSHHALLCVTMYHCVNVAYSMSAVQYGTALAKSLDRILAIMRISRQTPTQTQDLSLFLKKVETCNTNAKQQQQHSFWLSPLSQNWFTKNVITLTIVYTTLSVLGWLAVCDHHHIHTRSLDVPQHVFTWMICCSGFMATGTLVSDFRDEQGDESSGRTTVSSSLCVNLMLRLCGHDTDSAHRRRVCGRVLYALLMAAAYAFLAITTIHEDALAFWHTMMMGMVFSMQACVIGILFYSALQHRTNTEYGYARRRFWDNIAYKVYMIVHVTLCLSTIFV